MQRVIPRPVSLKIDPESLIIHHITSVRFMSDKTPVERLRSVKAEPQF